MGKFLRTLSVVALLLSSFSSNAQITIGTVDAGPYGYGSSITVPVTFPGNLSGLPSDNTFELFLSDAAGNFVGNGTRLGTFSGFYTAGINGLIPNTLAAGTGYRLRVRTSNPDNIPAATITDVPGTISISAVPSSAVTLTQTNLSTSITGDNLGFCPAESGNNKQVSLKSNATGLTTTTIVVTNLATGASTTYAEPPTGLVITGLASGTYAVTVTASTSVGVEIIKSVRTYTLHNNPIVVNIQDIGQSRGCLDGLGNSAGISFGINIPGGIGDNDPQVMYRVDWGDGTTSDLTLADIINNASRITHGYTRTSCGQPPIQGGTGTITNSFKATISAISPICGDAASTTAYAQIFLNPVAIITPSTTIGCLNIPMTFNNTSRGGTRFDCSTRMDYTWYVDGVVVSPQPTGTSPLVWTFTTAGTHTVRLEASNGVGTCTASVSEIPVCIQNPSIAQFTLPGATPVTICANTTLTPTNTSFIDNTCTPARNFRWIVDLITAGAQPGFAGGTTLNSENPQFIFSTPGVYDISLAIDNPTCGVVSSAKQRVVVNTTPTATLSPDITLCSTGTYSFNNLIPSSPTYTTVSGTFEDLPGTYTWTVSGNATIAGGANTKYPDITFNDFGTYTVTLVHTNNCSTTPIQTQVITFIPSPVVDPGPEQFICYADNINLNATVNGSSTNDGSYLSSRWLGGNGTFSDRTSLTASYVPTPQERASGRVIFTLEITTPLADPCRIISRTVTVNINPEIRITSAPTLQSCSGNVINYAITSNLDSTNPAAPITTYTWTAQSTTVTVPPTGSGNIIADQLTLIDPTVSGTVTYTITPTNNSCAGVPFQLIVTVTPVPVLTATPQNAIICNNQSVAIDLSSNLPGTGSTLYTWTSSVSNLIVQGNTSNSTPAAIAQIADVLTNLGTTDESVTYVITPHSASGCPGNPKTVTVTVKSAGVIANAGPDQLLCNETGAVLTGNAPLPGNTGQWSPVAGIVFGDISSPTTTVSGLIAGRTYEFKWTINGVDGCPGTEANVTIVNYNALTNTISSQSTEVCYGQMITITGDVPTGGNGTYTYSWESSADGTTWDVINGQTGKDLSYTLLGTLSFRRTVTSSTCSQFSNIITIIAQPPISNNNIAANQEICSGVVPAPLTGTQPTGSDGNFNYQWQSSTNGTTWTNISSAVFPTYTPAALTVTTYYRRVVSTITCNGGLASISLPVTITVKPDAKAEFTYTTDRACAPFVLTAQNVKTVPYADRNGTYTWFANNVQIGTGINFPGYTITNSNELVDIKLVVTSSLGCSQAEFTHTFGTIQNVVPAFTQSTAEGCGPLIVNFVNTSASLVNATFRWDFGNGTTSSQVMPGPVTFLPDPTGKDITYTVTLTATNACGVNSVTSTVFVKAKPIAVFSPSKTVGCSPMTVTFSNTSPGETNTYYYDFGDGTLLTKTDKSAVQHTFITGAVTDFVVKMRAVNECGTDESSYTIRVSPNTVLPELVVNANEREGCAPFKVNFYNNSKGANSFKYTFGDGSTVLTTSAPEVVAHTFTTPGTYTITLLASNGCSDTTTTETITVLPQPLAAFTADITLGCPGLPVQFRNTTTDGVAYLWDFGDGTTSTEFEPKHTFTGAQEYYTVSLTATNNLGCTYTATRNQYIHIVPPPVAKFNVNPSTLISIPNYTFRFEDETTNNPTIWLWDFGDGTTSALQNPSHTYPDTGSYVVNLRVTNQQGCFTTTFKTVTIVGVPGYLYVPNSFIPGSAFPELREFRAKGSGIKTWKMSIFNKWGQVLWETTKLEEGRPAEGWDGVFQATPVPQGVYFWKIDVEFINGAAWKGMTYDSSPPKKTGPIHLIR
jgi:PKD repeat protein